MNELNNNYFQKEIIDKIGNKGFDCKGKEWIKHIPSSSDRSINLSGKKFNLLTVLFRVEGQKRKPKWLCLCDCGKLITVTSSHLKDGHVKSCGCLQRVDLINKRFFNLLVLEKVYNNGVGTGKWKCLCDCRNITYVTTNHLTSGHTKSCGCVKSIGEKTIINILKENNISFETQKIFKNCKNPDTNYNLKFDFYIENNFLLEYDGEQHFIERGWNTKENLEKNKKLDILKDQWCKENGIPLKRIPYWELDNITINNIMDDTFLVV